MRIFSRYFCSFCYYLTAQHFLLSDTADSNGYILPSQPPQFINKFVYIGIVTNPIRNKAIWFRSIKSHNSFLPMIPILEAHFLQDNAFGFCEKALDRSTISILADHSLQVLSQHGSSHRELQPVKKCLRAFAAAVECFPC